MIDPRFTAGVFFIILAAMTHIASDGSNQSPLVATGTPVPGTDAQTYMASDGTLQEVLPVDGSGGGGEAGPVEWADVQNKPAVMGVGATQQEALTAIGAIPASQKGQANGVAPLDSAGLVPLEHLNVSGLTFKGAWNPVTNTPALLNGTGSTGDFYKASADGTFNFGNGDHTFIEGDWVMFAAGVWQRLGSKETVASVNGKMGVVDLTAADVGARPSSYVPAWSEVTSKPTTFPPTIGTTATTAKAGNYVPAWSEITGKPTVRGAIGPAIPAIYAWFLTDQTVTSGTITTLNWTNSAHDPFSMLSNGEFVVPSWAAYARVTASIQFSTNATGYRYVGYARNGVVQAATRQQPVGVDPSIVQLISPIRTMAADSVLSLRVWQNSGATLTVNPQSWVQIELYEAQ